MNSAQTILDMGLALALTNPRAAIDCCRAAVIESGGHPEITRRADVLLYALGVTPKVPKARVV